MKKIKSTGVVQHKQEGNQGRSTFRTNLMFAILSSRGAPGWVRGALIMSDLPLRNDRVSFRIHRPIGGKAQVHHGRRLVKLGARF